MMKQLLIIWAVVIFVAGTVGAAPTTLITFDEFPLGTIIDTDYSSLGVVFLTGDVTGRQPQISMNGAMPTQPVLRPTGEPDFYMYRGDFWIQFTTPAVEVQFDSGYWDYPGVGIIDVYDPYMNPLASLTNTTGGVNFTNLSEMGSIGYIYFNSIGDETGADIDNLAFSQMEPNLIPTPSAIVLGGIGLGLIGWLRRRRTL